MKLDEEDLLYYRDRFKVPLTDKQVKNIEYYNNSEMNVLDVLKKMWLHRDEK